jgi:hypothetical protein
MNVLSHEKLFPRYRLSYQNMVFDVNSIFKHIHIFKIDWCAEFGDFLKMTVLGFGSNTKAFDTQSFFPSSTLTRALTFG